MFQEIIKNLLIFILANGNYGSSAVNNTNSSNANQPSSVDVNANEKTTAQSPIPSQQQPQPQQQQQQTTTSGNTNNNSPNTSSNGPPKAQRERTNRVGAGGIRNKKPSNLTSDKHGSEKLVNGSS